MCDKIDYIVKTYVSLHTSLSRFKKKLIKFWRPPKMFLIYVKKNDPCKMRPFLETQ